MGRAAKIIAGVVVALVVVGALVGLYEEYEAARSLEVYPFVGVNGFVNVLGYTVPIPSFSLLVKNKSPYTLVVRDLKIVVSVEGTKLAKLEKSGVELGPSETETIPVEIEPSSWRAAAKGLGSLLTRGEVKVSIDGHATIPVRLFGVLEVFSVTVPIHAEKTLSVREKIEEIGEKIGESAPHLAPQPVPTETKTSGQPAIKVLWISGGGEASSVKPGSKVVAVVVISGYTGKLTVIVMKDRALMPDEQVAAGEGYVGGDGKISVAFTAQAGPGVRGYYVKVIGEAFKWEQPPSYPPRLRVG